MCVCVCVGLAARASAADGQERLGPDALLVRVGSGTVRPGDGRVRGPGPGGARGRGQPATPATSGAQPDAQAPGARRPRRSRPRLEVARSGSRILSASAFLFYPAAAPSALSFLSSS